MRRIQILALGLVAVQTSLLAWSACRQSPTYNEPAHLVAGVSYWQFGRFDVYRVNPPLTRMVAALPVVLLGPKTDWKAFDEQLGARPEFQLGKDFVAANGESSLWLFTVARWACIPFSWLGAWICFRWAKELFGSTAGILAVTLWCFEPNILAHAQLVTPDLGATAFGVASAYCFWRWLKTPTSSWTFVAGVALGIAALTKFTLLIFFVLWPTMWFVWRIADASARTDWRRWGREGCQHALMLLLALYVINFGYGFEGSLQRLRRFQFVSDMLADTHVTTGQMVTRWGSNRFADSRLGDLPIPLPSNFVLGLDLQKRDLEHYSWQKSYLRGQFQDHGWWYFYLYGLAIKVPLGYWVLVALAAGSALCRWTAPTAAPSTSQLMLLAPGLAILSLASSQTGFTIHLRYVLPILPFGLIFASRLGGSFVFRRLSLGSILTAVALTWGIGTSLWIYPHNLSYFNELVGGPRNGDAHLLHSNIDWGQDLLFVRDWLDHHSEARPLRLAYYGYFDPINIGIRYEFPSAPRRRSGTHDRYEALQPGWYAISVNLLRGDTSPAPCADGSWRPVDRTIASQLSERPYMARVGYSIYVFRILK